MKKDKNRIYGRLIKRSVSLMLCTAMFLNSGGDIGIKGAGRLFNYIAAYASSLDQITNGEEPAVITYDADNNITSLTITKSSELLWLANQDASRYSSAVITIAAGNGSPFSNEIVDFPGLGSETAPFGGTLQTSQGSTLYLFSNHALFNYILDTAKIHRQNDESLPAIVVINRVGDSDMALLAENVVHDTSATENDVLFDKLNMRIQLEENMNDVELKPFSGIIGTVGSGCRVKLNTFLPSNENNDPSKEQIKQVPDIASNGNVGLACCELKENSKLTFHYENGSNVNDYSVNSTDECAGGLVGIMRQGSELIVENDFSYKGNVSAGKSAGGLAGIMEGGATVTISNGGTTVYSGKITAGTNAGGLVGEMGSGATLSLTGNYTLASDAVIEGGSNAGGLVGLTEDEELNITGKTVISGTLKAVNAGGLAGYAKYSGNRTISAAHTATSGLDINGTTVSGTHCGGIFGCLENTGTTGKITISGGSFSSKVGENSTNYGGLAGSYKAAVLGQELDINGITVTSDSDGKTVTSFGGLIGELDGGTNGAYVQIHGITTANTNDVSSNITNYGGIVGNGGDNGNFVDITGGTVTVATDSNITDNNGYNGSAAGGLVGSMTSGVLRLNGTVNLSAAKPADNCNGTGRGLVLGYRRNTLVYAESGFTMTRYVTPGNRDDIGQWGDIVRYSAVGGNATIEYNSTDHTVKIKKHETLTNVGSNQDLARLALYIQLNTTGNKGTLTFEDPSVSSQSSTLLTSDININADVSFVGTGINSLTRDDGSNGAFTRTLDGKNHKVTLAVGDSSTGFRRCVYAHSHCGLFAKTGTATIKDITVAGTMNVYSNNIPNIDTNNEPTYGARVGGLVAQHKDGTLTVTNVKALQTVNVLGHEGGRNRVGGLIGDAVGGTVNLGTLNNDSTKCIVGCNINNTQDDAMETTTCSFGGVIGQSNGSTINVNNVQLSGSGTGEKFSLSVKNAAGDAKTSPSVGGFLGYEWLNTDAYINKLVIGTTENQALLKQDDQKAVIGGLLKKATGFVQLNDLTFANAKIEAYNNPTSFGMIVNDGKELYLEVTDQEWYKIGGLSCSIGTPSVYDEFVAYTNKNNIAQNENGVVSIPTSDRGGITYSVVDNVVSTNIYNNRIDASKNNANLKTKKNSNTRYYYNIDIYRQAPSTDGQRLLLWSLSQYSNSCKDLFKEHLGIGLNGSEEDYTISGNCNLTGLSYYPIYFPKNKTVNIADGTSITFDSKDITFNEQSDAVVQTASGKQNQLYMMHRGLFIDLDSSSKDDIRKLVIEGSLTLSGPITKIGSNTGALFCGVVKGSKATGDLYPNSADIKCGTNSEIILKNLYVRGYTDISNAAPLLIGKTEGYININLVGVKTYVGTDNPNNTYALPSGQSYAASSLIGPVGKVDANNDDELSQSVNISFSKIALDSRKTADNSLDSFYGTQKSIFSRATLLESFRYKTNSGSTGTYDFELKEDWNVNTEPYTGLHKVTYGKELSHSVEFKEKDKEVKICYLKSDIFVSADLSHLTNVEGSAYDFTSATYLPYVYHSPATDNTNYSVAQSYHELKINDAAENFTGGCGTYGDPYRITAKNSQNELVGSDQLSTLANILFSGNFSAGYEIGYNKSSDDCRKSVENGDGFEKHDVYRYQSGSFCKVVGDVVNENDTVDADVIFNHIRDAYYIIEDDITVETNFRGLGVESAPSQIFRGVIVGKKKADNTYPTLTMNGDKPLVKISGGCVVKDLNINYCNNFTITENKGGAFEPTNASVITIGCNYFGGVIGQVLAGDNIIDNVNVTFKRPDNSNTQITLNGPYSYRVPVGAYVGVVRNGGLILRGMSAKNTLSGNNLLIYDNDKLYNIEPFNMSDTNYLYINPYVGRVLDGYVVTDDENEFGDSAVNNGDKNYSVVKLKKDTNPLSDDKLSMTLLTASGYENVLSGLPKNSSGTGDVKNSEFTWSNIQVPNAQSLFVLSAMVASGAAAYQPTDTGYRNPKYHTEFHYFTDTSYCIGSTHLANYTNVQNLTDLTNEDYVIAKTDVRGKNAKSPATEVSKAIPYIVKYYTKEQTTLNKDKKEILDKYPTRIICSSNTRFSVTLSTANTTYDMPKGFRGINAMYNNTSYSVNPDRQVINMFGFNGNGCTVNMNMNIWSYGNNDAYNPFGVGLYPRFQQNTSGETNPSKLQDALKTNNFSGITDENLTKYKNTYAVTDLTITGQLSYNVPEQNGIKATTEFRSTSSDVIINQTVNVGGFAGRNYDSDAKTLYYWFDNIAVNANLSGGFGTGALIGAIGDFEYNTKGFNGKGATGNGNKIANANIQTIVANNISSNGLNISEAKYAGGLFGIVTKTTSGIWVDCAGNINSTPVKPVIVSSITASMEENRCGGLIGSTSKNLTVKNTKVMGASGALGIIGETAENTYKSTKHAGGIAGYVGGDSDVRDSEVKWLSVNVRSDKENNYAGGIIGYTDKTGTYSDCVVDSCTIYLRNANSGNLGGLCGCIKGEGNIQNIVIKDNIIKINNNGNNIHTRLGGVVGSLLNGALNGFNILLKDNTMQVLYDGSVPTSYKSNTTVGNWVGNSSGKLVKLVAASKQGDASKYMKDDIGSVNNLNAENSIVYSDYNGSALGGTHNTNGKSPYLHINPVAQNLTDLPKMDGTSGSETVLGNGLDLWTDVSDNKKYPLAKHIIDEATDDTVDNTDYSKIVNDAKVLVLSNSFTFSADDGNVITFNTQIRNDNSNGVDLNLPEVPEDKDFPVLVIKNNETEAVNSLVKDYISVLTNETRLNINSWEVKTYKRTNTGWITANVRNSLKGGNELVSVPGQYDNEKGQFTMIKAVINSPVSNSSDKLELYIPVVVKKVLQFKVDTKVVSDTKYRTGEYNHGRVIENNGVPITTLITFSYCSRTYQEWLDSIYNGEDYFWNYNKCIMFKHDDGQRALPHDADKPAQVTLVDKNNDDKAYYGTLAENGVFNAENGKIDFQHLKEYTGSTNEKSFEPVTLAKLLCEQLELKAVATEDADVCFVEIDEVNIGMDERSVPTVMAYLNGKPAYFRLYDADDEAVQPPKYAISIGSTYNPTVVKNITEQYYLTLKTDKSIDDLFYMRVMFSPKSLPAENAKMATYNITEETEYDTLVLANFFTQDNFKIITSGNEEITDSTSFITTDMSVDLTFKKDNYSAFNEYGRNVGLEQGFVMSYVKYSADDSNKEAQQILGSTKLCGTFKVKDKNGDDIAGSESEIDETISSSCSEYLLRYKGNNLRTLLVPENNQPLTEDKTITMNAHFNIKFSEFDDSMIEFQFPSHQSGSNEDSNTVDKSGLVVCGKSNIAYETDKLQNSIVSTGHAVEDGYGYFDDNGNEPKDANRYYCSIAEQASLQYNAVNEDTGDSQGKISQLGINANELSSDVSKVRINALGIYDASVLAEAREADMLVLEFELKRKYMNSNSYDQNSVVDIEAYLKNFDLIVAGTSYKNNLVKNRNVYRVEIDNWKNISGDNATVDIKTTFDVLTNADFQYETYMYSNYKLTLTPYLKKGNIKVTGSDAPPDWIVYTNSRIYTDIID